MTLQAHPAWRWLWSRAAWNMQPAVAVLGQLLLDQRGVHAPWQLRR